MVVQAQGNIRWTKIHLLKSLMLLGDTISAIELKDQERIWEDIDPETSITAGFFYTENLPQSRRKNMLLRELKKRAKRNGLGEVLQRIAAILPILCLFVLSNNSLIYGQNQEIHSSRDVAQISDFLEETTYVSDHSKGLLDMLPHRGNTADDNKIKSIDRTENLEHLGLVSKKVMIYFLICGVLRTNYAFENVGSFVVLVSFLGLNLQVFEQEKPMV